MRKVVKTGDTYDAVYNTVYIGTYPSKVQAEAALKGVSAYLANLANSTLGSKEPHKGIRHLGKRWYVTYPKGVKGSFGTLAEALACQTATKANQPCTQP